MRVDKKLTGWQDIGGFWYYLGTDGKMLTGWQQINNVWYYVEAEGTMIRNSSKQINGKIYNFDANGVCLNP
ncbi:MAG: choline-binding protein A [Candidatus Pararuminococcus gallinarum]|jgi:glucan-binding YG repeat protein